MPVQFVYPFFLWFSAALLIPVIVHLFNFRRFKKIDFTNVRLLKEIKDQTQSQSRLRHLLVLLMRLLALLFLILAFAQPYIPTNNNNVSGQAIVGLYLDNSYSMNLLGKEGSLLDQAKAKCRLIVESFPSSAKFQLLTNDFKGEQQRLLDKDQTLEYIDRIKPTSISKNLNEILIRQHDALSQSSSENRSSFIFSDFQKNFFNQETTFKDSSLKLNFIKLEAEEVKNISIDSCWLSSPVVQLNEPITLNVMVTNRGDENSDVPLKVYLNGNQKSVTTLAVKSGSSVSTQINFSVNSPGWQKMEVVINDNPVTFDDHYYLSFLIAEKIRVYHIAIQKNSFINKLLSNNPLIDYNFTSPNAVDYSRLKNINAVILSDLKEVTSGMSNELTKFVSSGGTLVIFPDTLINPDGYQKLFTDLNVDNYVRLNGNKVKVAKLDFENNLFHNMFDRIDENMNLPEINAYYELSSNTHSSRIALMSLQNNAPLLNYYQLGMGNVYQFTSAAQIASGNLVSHALFAPVLFKTLLLSVPSVQPSLFIGNNTEVSLNFSLSANDILHLKNKALNSDLIPEYKTTASGYSIYLNAVEEAGFYDLVNSKDSIVSVLALNYNRKESDMQFSSDDELQARFDQGQFRSFKLLTAEESTISRYIKGYAQGISLWKYCLLLALLFFAIESLLLRTIKFKST